MTKRHLSGFIKGEKKLRRQMKKFRTTDVNMIVSSALLAGGRIVRDEARKRVPAKWKKKKMGIRSRSKKPMYGPKSLKEIKVGWSVGQKRDKSEESSRGWGKGVGITGKNIHWMVLGTKKRYHKNGTYTGRISRKWGRGLRGLMKGAARVSRRRTLKAIMKKGKSMIEKYRAKGKAR